MQRIGILSHNEAIYIRLKTKSIFHDSCDNVETRTKPQKKKKKRKNPAKRAEYFAVVNFVLVDFFFSQGKAMQGLSKID